MQLGSIRPGSPVHYRGIEVGSVTAIDLSTDATAAQVQVFIAQRYERLVRIGSRFWNGQRRGRERRALPRPRDQYRVAADAGGGRRGLRHAGRSGRAPGEGRGPSSRSNEKPQNEWLEWRPKIPVAPPRQPDVRRALLIAILGLALAAPHPGAAAEPLSWETGEGKSYVIPALEIGGFLTGLNQVNRHLIDSKEYGSDGHSIGNNLPGRSSSTGTRSASIRSGHPYQGNIYFGFARSAGLDFWRSLAYSLGGSLLWETTGETSPPVPQRPHQHRDRRRVPRRGRLPDGEPAARRRRRPARVLARARRRDHLPAHRLQPARLRRPVRRGLPEPQPGDLHPPPARRDADQRREQQQPQQGREAAGRRAGLLDHLRPPGQARLPVQAASRLLPLRVHRGPHRARHHRRHRERVDPRTPRGRPYDLGDDFRGVWGVFGNYDYFSPQIFRVSSTAVSMGTVFQWWLTRHVALQGTALGGSGSARRAPSATGPSATITMA